MADTSADGDCIGIVGGGQLARMLVLAGAPLGLRFTVLDPAADACAGQVADLIRARYDDPAALDELAAGCDRVTFDFENVPLAAARRLAERVAVFPPPQALAAAQDRLDEKTLCNDLGIATAPFAAVDDAASLREAVARIGLPGILKTRRLGYDGKGQRALYHDADLAAVCAELDETGDSGHADGAGAALIYEGRVDFQCEVSVLALRGRDGATAFYPLAENVHRDGILRVSGPCPPALQRALGGQARELTGRLLQRLDYVGLLAVEYFVVDGELLANEMAPRVHNSGHWTIEGAVTSQFENHLRAGCGLPLGATALRGHCRMLNLIGRLPPLASVLAVSGAHYHHYGKQPRPGRKVGHVTVQSDDPAVCSAAGERVLALLDDA